MRPRGAERPRGRRGSTDRGEALGSCALQARSCSRIVSSTKRMSHLPQLGTAWRPRAGRDPGPRRESRPRCDAAHGATSSALLSGRSFAFLVFPSPAGVGVRLPAALQRLPRLFAAGGTEGGLASRGPFWGRGALRRRARRRARSPPPELFSAFKAQYAWYLQPPPLPLQAPSRSGCQDCLKWDQDNKRQIWRHLELRRGPQAWSRDPVREILTAR